MEGQKAVYFGEAAAWFLDWDLPAEWVLMHTFNAPSHLLLCFRENGHENQHMTEQMINTGKHVWMETLTLATGDVHSGQRGQPRLCRGARVVVCVQTLFHDR